MQKRHFDRQLYFSEQEYTTKKYVIPFIRQRHPVTPDAAVLEIGCGEGGNMKPFLDAGCQVTGIDICRPQIEQAEQFYASHPHRKKLTLIVEDIYKVTDLGKQFDIILLRDVIEHIPNQDRFMSFIKQFMKPSGVVFIGFPPWQNPFGGHQQVADNKFLSHLPWFHLLPRWLYKNILCWGGIDPQSFLEIKNTGISLERLEKIVREENYAIGERNLYVINPNYEIKFHLKPRRLWKPLNIPYLRNFYTTCGYYLLSLK